MPATPRKAATILVLRDNDGALEVLMVKRSMESSFMPGAYVFPGGAVENADADVAARDLAAADLVADHADWQACLPGHEFFAAAVRECSEECGLQVNRLAPWAHWVTPVEIPKRFDTWFFIATAPADQTAKVDQHETTAFEWVSPPSALERGKAGTFQLEFATRAILKSVVPFANVDAVLGEALRPRAIPAIHPRLTSDEAGRKVILMPGDPGYAQLKDPAPDNNS